METCLEDAMDLGGFLENYVLSNPFSHRTLSHKPDSSLQDNRPTSEISKSITKSLAGSALNQGTEDVASQTEESKCGHVGSNRVYAASLKEQKVSIAHQPLQDWLLSQYQIVADSQVLIRSSELVEKVQKQFPLVTSVVLSRTMRFTFPSCRKVINKQGTFWQGLVEIQDGQSTYVSALTYSPPQNRICTTEVKERLRSKINSSEIHSEVKLEDRGDPGAPCSELGDSSRKLHKRKRKRTVPCRKAKPQCFGIENSPSHLLDCTEIDNAVNDSNCLKQKHLDGDQTGDTPGQYNSDHSRHGVEICGSEQDVPLSTKIQPSATMPVPVCEIKQEKTEDVNLEYAKSGISCGSSCDETANKKNATTASDQATGCSKDLALENRRLKQNCRALQDALVSSQTQVTSLTEQLAKKDLELTELADEFFELSRGFHRFSQRFHCVLQGSVEQSENNTQSDDT